MKGDEGDIFSKAPDQKTLFLFKIKIKQNPGCLNKEYNVVFKHFHQNIRAYPRSNVAYWEESEQSNVLVKNFGLSQTQLGCLGGVAMPGKFYSFWNLSWKQFPVLKLTRNCYLYMNISSS